MEPPPPLIISAGATPPRPRRFRHRLGVLALTVGLAGAAAGCQDSGDGESTDETAAQTWASDVCSALGDWTTTLDDARASLANPPDLSVNDIRQSVDEVGSATSTLVSDLDALSPPDTEAGDAAEERLSSLTDELEEQADNVRETTDEEAATLDERLAQASTVSGAAAEMVAEVKSAVADLRDLDGAQELRDAFQGATTCQELDS